MEHLWPVTILLKQDSWMSCNPFINYYLYLVCYCKELFFFFYFFWKWLINICWQLHIRCVTLQLHGKLRNLWAFIDDLSVNVAARKFLLLTSLGKEMSRLWDDKGIQILILILLRKCYLHFFMDFKSTICQNLCWQHSKMDIEMRQNHSFVKDKRTTTPSSQSGLLASLLTELTS